MSDNKWDDKLTEKFLTLYRRHKCLWNPYSSDYKNCSIKNEAFETVVKELNVPGIWKAECLQQIEVIRERYKEEQVRTKNGLKSGNFYNSKISWFNLMSEMLCEVIKDEENFGNNSRIKNFALDKEAVHEVDNRDRSDRFFSDECIWDKYKEEEKPYGKKIQFVNCKDSGLRIEAKNSIGVCRNEASNNFVSESVDATRQDKSGVFGVEEECLSGEKEGNNNKEMSSCVRCSVEKKNIEKCCRERMEDSPDCSKPATEKKLSEGGLRDEATDCEMSKAVASGCDNSCVERFRSEKVSKFSNGFDEDGYNVCSRFKIVIPGPASKDHNLEITGYEIRVMNNRQQPKDSGLEEDLSERCVCRSKKRFLPLPGKVNFSGGQDSTRFGEGGFIKLDISRNNLKEIQGNRRRKSKDEDFKSRNETRINKKTQTENFREDEPSQNERDESNYSKVFLRDQESSTDDSLTTNLATRGSIGVRSDVESSVASRDKSAARNRSIVETENVSCCAESKSESGREILQNGGTERFNNTRMVLNVIVKILQGDESQNDELQKTLDTMLETIDQRISIVGLKDGAESSSRKANRIYYPPTKNSLNESTRYQNLPDKFVRGKKMGNNVMENSRQTPLVNDGVEITDSESESPEVVHQNYYNEIPALDETPMPLLPGERIEAPNGGVNNESRDEPITTERGTPVIDPHDDVLKIPKFSSDPILNYTMNGFEGEEPIASSSRRISEEPRTPNELTKEFLDVVKYTIMMDRILEGSENAAGNDRLNNR